MRVIFMGTPDFSVAALVRLVEAGHEVVAVVTQPDKPKGRGHEVQMTPVKEKALEYKIPVYQPVKVRESSFVEEIRALNPDVIVVVAFGQIISKEILEIPKYGCVNIHASLLPKYRGAAPIQQVILDGETETGITTMQMDEGLDTGDMLERVVVAIAPDETGGSLHDKLCEEGGKLILSTLKGLEAGTITPIAQSGETCYAKRLTKELGNVDWNESAVVIERLIRGLNPWPSAYTSWNGKTVKLWAAKVLADEGGASFAPGEVIESGKDRLVVQTGDGCLEILQLQLPGKKRMDAASLLRGYAIPAGSKFERVQ